MRMAYRNGTYVAFDGQGTTDPSQSDMKYYGLLQSWNTGKNYELNFSDSHKKTYQVQDSSLRKTLENRLLERMRNSKNMLLILSQETNYDRGMLNFEIEKAVDYYKIPIIVAYTGCDYLLDAKKYANRWPKALDERIYNNTVKAIHIPFKEKAIMEAISQFSVNSTGADELSGSLCTYKESVYIKWGYLNKLF
jgi:hypothetical protein